VVCCAALCPSPDVDVTSASLALLHLTEVMLKHLLQDFNDTGRRWTVVRDAPAADPTGWPDNCIFRSLCPISVNLALLERHNRSLAANESLKCGRNLESNWLTGDTWQMAQEGWQLEAIHGREGVDEGSAGAEASHLAMGSGVPATYTVSHLLWEVSRVVPRPARWWDPHCITAKLGAPGAHTEGVDNPINLSTTILTSAHMHTHRSGHRCTTPYTTRSATTPVQYSVSDCCNLINAQL
jgi:hypothetical protein